MERLARGLIWLVQRFSLGTIRKFGRFLGFLAYHALGSRRRTALSNLDLAYGESLTQEEKVRIAKNSFVNLVTLGLEFCWMPACSQPTNSLMHLDNPEVLLNAYRERKGVIILVPHMGNWEFEARWFAGTEMVCHAVSRSQKQAWVNRLVREIRSTTGVHEIDKRNALRPCLAAIRRGEAILMLIDQHSRKEAVVTQFFGKPAMTTASVALLAQKTGCNVLVGACYRCQDGRFGGVFSDPIHTQNTGDREKDLRENTQRYVSEIEEYVRQHPEEWMWMHRRWRVKQEPTSA